jgi:hypothetical protein
MYLTLEEFLKYTNVHENTEISLQIVYLESAENIIKDYLGYDPVLQNYMSVFIGNGTNRIQLKAKPVQRIIQVKYDEIIIPPTSFIIKGEFIYNISLSFAEGQPVTINYLAGYDISLNENNEDDELIDGGRPDSTYNDESIDGGSSSSLAEPMPNIIKLTGLRIAALLQTESDNNIGITGKSFGDSGSRTFVNYTNFDKYLLPIRNRVIIT